MSGTKALRPTSPVHVHVDDDIPVHVHVKQPKKKKAGQAAIKKISRSTVSSRARSKSPGNWVPPPARTAKGSKVSWQGKSHQLEIIAPRDALRMEDLSTDEEDRVHNVMRGYEHKIDNLMSEVGTLKNEVNSEFYTGWLDHWGEKHSTTAASAVAKSLDLILALDANVNMYMFEGGTNFGYWNGAEFKPSFKANPTSYDYDAPLSEAGDISEKYLKVREVIKKAMHVDFACSIGANYPYHPVPTSYDYDAPLTEAGDITDKYMTLRQVIAKYNPATPVKVPPSTPKSAYGRVNMEFVDTVLNMSVTYSPRRDSIYPMTFEALDHYYGFVAYGSVFGEKTEGMLDVSGVRDRGYVSVLHRNDNSLDYIGVVDRTVKPQQLNISVNQDDALIIIVENQGRINYGGQMNNNRKGIITNVTINGQNKTDWSHYIVNFNSVTLAKPATAPFSKVPDTIPSIFRGQLEIKGEPQDTYLDMSKWTKGQLFVNGQNMGRYWPAKGPQVRLYIPKYALRTGNNTIVLAEMEKNPCAFFTDCYIELMDTPLINATVKADTPREETVSVVYWLFSVLLRVVYGGLNSLFLYF